MGAALGGPVRLPPHAPGMRIGLYGGSFDPPHPGHLHVARLAMRRLGLDRIWWLVTPGNPLKERSGLPKVEQRLAATRALAADPRMAVSALEAQIRSAYTVETVRFLVRRCPGVRFVLIVGADSLATFHRWRDWREIARLVPIAVVDRPGWTLAAQRGKAATALGRYRVDAAAATRLAVLRAPAWTFIQGPRSHLSSTALRRRAGPRRDAVEKRGQGTIS